MIKRLNLDNALIVWKITRFLSLSGSLYLFMLLLIKIFKLELDATIFFSLTVACIFLSSSNLMSKTTLLLTAFSFRKNTKSFLIKMVVHNLLYTTCVALFSVIWFFILSPKELNNISTWSIGYVIQTGLILYSVISSLELSKTIQVTTHNSTSHVEFRLTSILKFVFIYLAVALLVIITFLGSFALGSYLTLLCLAYFFTHNPFVKNLLDKNSRSKALACIVLLLTLVTISLSAFEWSRGNKSFLYTTQLEDIIKNKSFTKKYPENKSEIKDFSSWASWMTNNKLSPEEYIDSLKRLEALCTPSKDLNPLRILCDSVCKNQRFWISVEDIKALDEKEKALRIDLLLNEISPNYMHLIALIHYGLLNKPSDELTQKVESIAKNPNHEYQFLAQRVLDKDVNKTTANMVFTGTQSIENCKK